MLGGLSGFMLRGEACAGPACYSKLQGKDNKQQSKCEQRAGNHILENYSFNETGTLRQQESPDNGRRRKLKDIHENQITHNLYHHETTKLRVLVSLL